jgi:hypothetical protein
MNLSLNFTLEEMIRSDYAARRGWPNEPNDKVIANLKRLAILLEEVRSELKCPIIVNSAYRSEKVNSAIGGTKNSQHMLGCAADIRGVNRSPDDLMLHIIGSDIKYDQLIKEFDSWVHISIPNNPDDKPRMQKLVIDKVGVRPYQ